MEEITTREARLLLLVDTTAPARRIVGFVNFRMTLQGEVWNAMEGPTCLYMYDVQLLPEFRRKVELWSRPRRRPAAY